MTLIFCLLMKFQPVFAVGDMPEPFAKAEAEEIMTSKKALVDKLIRDQKLPANMHVLSGTEGGGGAPGSQTHFWRIDMADKKGRALGQIVIYEYILGEGQNEKKSVRAEWVKVRP